jgi:hypothetical protein
MREEEYERVATLKARKVFFPSMQLSLSTLTKYIYMCVCVSETESRRGDLKETFGWL